MMARRSIWKKCCLCCIAAIAVILLGSRDTAHAITATVPPAPTLGADGLCNATSQTSFIFIGFTFIHTTDDFAGEDVATIAPQIAKSTNAVLARVAALGISGLDRALAYEELHDLLVATKQGKVLKSLITEAAGSAKPIIDGIVAIIENQKKGNVLTIREMRAKLPAA